MTYRELGNVCNITKGKQLGRLNMIEDGKYAIQNGGIDYSGYTDKFNTDENTITISEGGNSCGYVNLIKEKFWAGGHCYTLTNLKNIDKNYLYFVLKYYQKDIMNLRLGSGLPNIQKKDIEKFKIPYLEIEQQRLIGKTLSNIDKLIDETNNLLNCKNEMIKSQFVEMFGDVINNTENFDYEEIGKLSTIVTGTTPSTLNAENWNGNICWITPAELDNATIYVSDSNRKITEIGQRSKSLKLMPKGTVLFTTRAPIGKVAILKEEMCCNQGFKNCICKDKFNNLYLYYVLKNNTYYFNRLGAGSTFRELSKSVFEKIKISVPPIELQNKFASLVELIDKQKFELEKQKKNYELLKKGIMQKTINNQQ